MEIGQKCVATDRNGSYYREPCEVVGFETNMLGLPLVRVKLEPYDWGDDWDDADEPVEGRETVFYPSELQPEE